MNKIYTLLLVAACICAGTTLHAKSWRINSNTKAKADFTSVTEAIASEKVVDDDELYLEAGHVEQGDITITKRLHLIGPGYWHENASSDISYTSSSALINGKVYFTKAGSGTSITGCTFKGTYVNAGDCDATNITITRCLILASVGTNCNSSSWNIINCYITGRVSVKEGNNIIGCIILADINLVTASTGTIISNNVLIGNDSFNGYSTIGDIPQCTLTNNIIINTKKGSTTISIPSGKGINATNNIICQSETIEGFPDNVYSPYKLEDIFKMTGNEESMYELKEDSPAKGKGTHGTDCGAYGGERPYVKGGYPQFIPVIYDVKVPNNPTDGKLPVQLKIRTQND